MRALALMLCLLISIAENPFASENQYPGYLPIKRESLSMFYWLFKHKDISVPEAPLVLWLQGGPGCSDVENALFSMGPFTLQPNKTLSPNQYSWNSYADLLFVDQPICVGFSYCNNISQTPLTEELVCADLYTFLKGFVELFPEYKGRKLYIAGHSYGGHYVPSLAEYLLNKKDGDLNIAGIAIGNGWFDSKLQVVKNAGFLEKHFKLGVVQKLAAEMSYTISNVFNSLGFMKMSGRYWEMGDRILKRINSLFCEYDITKKARCLDEEIALSTSYVNTKEVYDALGISSTKAWESCNMDVYGAMYVDLATSTTGALINVLNAGIKTIIYQGSRDFICNDDGVANVISNIEWKYASEFNSLDWQKYYVMGLEVGKIKTYGPLTFLTDNYSGHMVVNDDRPTSFDIFQRLIS